MFENCVFQRNNAPMCGFLHTIYSIIQYTTMHALSHMTITTYYGRYGCCNRHQQVRVGATYAGMVTWDSAAWCHYIISTLPCVLCLIIDSLQECHMRCCRFIVYFCFPILLSWITALSGIGMTIGIWGFVCAMPAFILLAEVYHGGLMIKLK